MGFKEETLVLSEALQGGSNWHKALANLKNNGITGKIVGDKIIIKKNGKVYEISKSLNNLPEDLASNKLDIITVFANRNNGGVSPKHSEDFTAKTNLRLLGKALKEENLEDDEAEYEEIRKKQIERRERRDSENPHHQYYKNFPVNNFSNFPGTKELNKRGIKLSAINYDNGKISFTLDVANAPKLMSYLASNTGDYSYGGNYKDFPKTIEATKKFSDEYVDRRNDIDDRDFRKWGNLSSFLTDYGTSSSGFEFINVPKKWQKKIQNMINPFLNNISKSIIKTMLKDKKYRDYLINLRADIENEKTKGYTEYGEKVPPLTNKERRQHRSASFSVNTDLKEENLENYENTLEENIMSESKNLFSYEKEQAWLTKARNVLVKNLNNVVKPYIEKYLKNGENVSFVISKNSPSIENSGAQGRFIFPLSIVIKLANGKNVRLNISKKYDGGLYGFEKIDDSAISNNKEWNSIFKHRVQDLPYFNSLIIKKISEAYRQYAKEIVHDKKGRDLRTNYKGMMKDAGDPLYLTKRERLAYEDYEEDYEENTLNEGFRFFNY